MRKPAAKAPSRVSSPNATDSANMAATSSTTTRTANWPLVCSVVAPTRANHGGRGRITHGIRAATVRACAATGYLSPGVKFYGRRWWPCREITTLLHAGDRRAAAAATAVQVLTEQFASGIAVPSAAELAPATWPRSTAGWPCEGAGWSVRWCAPHAA